MSGAVYPLQGNQRLAVNPRESVWLSASAGTGKTQVLSARVFRLLLQPGVDPSQILCLTFTKAGAAEMAVRINSVLARWVRMKDTELAAELGDLGADTGPETRARARTLFANVLDTPGGGLRIDTIHAFSQWLLANFPNEAELIPGARPIEDRERELLSREVLSEMLVEAENGDDRETLDAIGEFSRRKDPDSLRAWLMRCASAHGLWFGKGAWQPPMRPQVLQLLGLPSDANEGHLAEMCDDDTFDTASLLRCRQTLAEWNTKAGREGTDAIDRWIIAEPAERARTISDLYFGLFTKTTDAPKQLSNVLKRDPEYGTYIERVHGHITLIREYEALIELAGFLAPALEIGRKFALRWDKAKTREGLLDFDDLIERAARLLKDQAAADWIRYKLDRRFDHILIDEAQDTNAAQWSIIDGLIDDFFSGEGAAGDKIRTVFAVGDYKQAIFGFQGTSPENFKAAKHRVMQSMQLAADNAAELRGKGSERELIDLDLGASFRTSKPVLEFVDQAIATIGHASFGLDVEPTNHVGEDRPGLVTLWNPVRDEREEDPAGEGDENWLARHDRKLADKIASQVKRWVDGDEPYVLHKGASRDARPGDIMVLVRKRRELASLIVARLHAKGVPVAGVDRLRLGAPLAVKDLMAALRFAAQPLDDLNLANLLVSPLIGWSQDDLLAHAPRDKGRRLWHHLRAGEAELVKETVATLRELLALADFQTPEALLHWMLVGPWRGRQKLIGRLGREAGDPIDELANAAFAYEAVHTPSLTGFIRWFDAGDGELKRDPGETPDLVRVMTVHGSKGLQAPIVILADATGRPGEGGDLALTENTPDKNASKSIPIPRLNSDERVGPIAEAHEAARAEEMREHWRLLYVAMTRAEEALFIGGSLSPRDKEPHADSWYARVAPIFGDDAMADDLWEARRELGFRSDAVKQGALIRTPVTVSVPDWATNPIGPEPRPPRPLAPSSAGEEQGADPPLPADEAREASRRGVLIHRLLERLPEVEPSEHHRAAEAWLAAQARELSDEKRAEIVRLAIDVIARPEFSEVFGNQALAEVPLAATVGDEVIAGVADRLLVTPDRVTVVDFKTARRPPRTLASIPSGTLRQMGAYVAALEAIYPDREVVAAVLYTQTPELFALPKKHLDPYKNAFQKR